MTCLVVAAIGLVGTLTVGLGPKSIGGNTLDLSGFVVSQEVPAGYRLSHCPYRDGGILVGNGDIQGDLAEREREYSVAWITRALRRTGIPTDTWTKGLHFVSNIHDRDDGAFILYSYRGYSFEVIDYRALTVLVRKNGLATVPLLDIFWDIVKLKPISAEVLVTDEHIVAGSEAYGRLKVDRDGRRGWFSGPIEWYRNGDAVLFLFTKELIPTSSKIPRRPENGPRWIGGIPDDDPRPWLRFENSNRVELAQEYMQKRLESKRVKKMQEPQADPDTPAKIHGRPIGPGYDDD